MRKINFDDVCLGVIFTNLAMAIIIGVLIHEGLGDYELFVAMFAVDGITWMLIWIYRSISEILTNLKQAVFKPKQKKKAS